MDNVQGSRRKRRRYSLAEELKKLEASEGDETQNEEARQGREEMADFEEEMKRHLKKYRR